MTKPVTVYTTPICPYCARAKSLLAKKGVAYQEVDVMMDDKARERRALARDVQSATEQNELMLHYQVPLLIHSRPKVGVGRMGLNSRDAVWSEGKKLCSGASRRERRITLIQRCGR